MNALQAWLYLREARRHLRLSADELRRMQEARLRHLVAHAYTRVPYYRRLFDGAGLAPDAIRTLDDLRRIPITRKETFRALPLSDRLAAGTDIRRCVQVRTSGSTGIPLDVYYSPEAFARQSLLGLRSELESGVGLRDRVLSLRVPAVAPHEQWFHRLGILRKEYINLWLSPADVLTRLRQSAPAVLVGYASHLGLLAHAARDAKMDDLRVRRLFTTSEPLDEPTRRLLTGVFHGEVFVRYDSWEGMLIGWECEQHRGFHIEADHIIVECLRDGEAADGPGEVVITNLDSDVMPIVRYALDDVASLSPEPCPCGRTFPLIQAVHGRTPDIIRLPDGRMVDGLVVNMLFKAMDGVRQFRLTQEAAAAFLLELVPASDFSPTVIEQVTARFHQHLGADLQLRAEIMPEIPPGPGGKHRYLVSKVGLTGAVE